MPGSHHAGMSVTRNCNLLTQSLTLTDTAVQTQSLDITGQLEAGSRYFDIRPAFGRDSFGQYVLHTYHRVGGVGCDGETIQDVTDQVVAVFLELHPTETVILKISHVPKLDKDDKYYVPEALRAHFMNPRSTKNGKKLIILPLNCLK